MDDAFLTLSIRVAKEFTEMFPFCKNLEGKLPFGISKMDNLDVQIPLIFGFC